VTREFHAEWKKEASDWRERTLKVVQWLGEGRATPDPGKKFAPWKGGSVMQGDVEISLKTDQETGRGFISGSGSLSLEVSDATKGTLELDYESPNSLRVKITSTTALRILNKDLTITLGGEKLLKARDVAGKAELSLLISKEVAASLSQKIDEHGGQTTLTVTVSF